MAETVAPVQLTGKQIYEGMVATDMSVPEYSPLVVHSSHRPELRMARTIGTFRRSVEETMGSLGIHHDIVENVGTAASEIMTNGIAYSSGGLLEARFGYSGPQDTPDSWVLDMRESTLRSAIPRPPDIERMLQERRQQAEELDDLRSLGVDPDLLPDRIGRRGLAMLHSLGFQLGRTVLESAPHTVAVWAQLPQDAAA